ncbi:nitric-oxide reductase large subunit [Anaeromyxobacter diazotrophicus]|uniref:Nitric oxide reductase n=1 Tax=Anaeromyxobacter diazotrophicus TaxID=2590199 RepID=A0A7I9VNY6_9BACT|nr:nitric-oxide reductase large subunit [Anaeromyxobacter diazotrophicus]GEJ57810.1 nitric oxide reductase [Anaeromyxobacter diazotrophicus]
MSDGDLERRPLSPWWRHGVILVMIFGFSGLGVVTALTYRDAPPIPGRVVDPAGDLLFTGEEVEQGQEIFFKHGLMEHGTLWGHGAYLGPDYTAEYLHREVEIARDGVARSRYGQPFAALPADAQLLVSGATQAELKANRYDPATGALVFSQGEADAFRQLEAYWADYFSAPNRAPGLPAKTIADATELRRLNAFFSWATWATVTNRPGKAYTYTNNWPYDPEAGNHPSTEAYVWSALSLVSLLGGLGLVLLIFGKYHFLGWHGEEADAPPSRPARAAVLLTPSQRAVGKYLAVVAVLFLLQTLVGGGLAHYRVEPFSFYGLDAVARLFPYHLLRTFHLQLAIFWIATAWVAGGLFLAPWAGGGEPPRQKLGVDVLFWALVVVVFGSLGGEVLSLGGRLDRLWFWLGHQGSEYLDLGRFWQLLLAAGLLFWLFLMFRALRPAIHKEGKGEISALFLYAATAIPVFYLPALFYGPRTNFAIIDNWRFWIIHLWVEGFFELFATVLVAIMFRHIGLVSTRTATRLVYLDAILFLVGGIMGTGHHWYFTGQGTLNMGLAACFSALEVVPLTLLTLDASGFIQLGKGTSRQASSDPDNLAAKQKWAIYFFIAVGVWNFIGAGIFGFLINTPIVSYYEVGTVLTANHGHGAMFGVFGMLGLGVLVFCLRALQGDAAWRTTEKFVRVGYWGLNAGLALMMLVDLFPAGVLQLWDVLQHGYWHARRLDYAMQGLFHRLEWARAAGDTVFLVLGVLPIAAGTLRATILRPRGGEGAGETLAPGPG